MVLEWPSQFSDFNLTENLWPVLKVQVHLDQMYHFNPARVTPETEPFTLKNLNSFLFLNQRALQSFPLSPRNPLASHQSSLDFKIKELPLNL